MEINLALVKEAIRLTMGRCQGPTLAGLNFGSQLISTKHCGTISQYKLLHLTFLELADLDLETLHYEHGDHNDIMNAGPIEPI